MPAEVLKTDLILFWYYICTEIDLNSAIVAQLKVPVVVRAEIDFEFCSALAICCSSFVEVEMH